MHYLSPDRSPINFKYPKNTPRSNQTITLPSLNKPQREKIDSFISQDLDKKRQKLRESLSMKDISFLKEVNPLKAFKEDCLQVETQIENFPTALSDIFALVYPDSKLSHSFLKLLNSRLSSKRNDFKQLLQVPKKDFYIQSSPTNLSSRQVTLNLKLWLENIESKYTPLFTELLNTPGFEEKHQLLKLWKSIYAVTNKEIIRQVAAQCSERGSLLQKSLEETEKLTKLEQKLFKSQQADTEKKQESRLTEFIQPYLNETVLLQTKVHRLEKEKEKWTKNKAEMIVKSKELINYLEVLRKFEDQVKHIKGKSRYFDSYISFFNSIAVEEINDFSGGNLKDKLKDELNEIIKEIFKNKQKVQKNIKVLKDLEDDIVDKESKLASLAFEIDVKEGIVKNKLRKNEKFSSFCESVSDKKDNSPLPRVFIEDEKVACEKFFKKLVVKSKERLIHKSKVSAEHIFKSLGVIYNRCVSQINSSMGNYSESFQFLIYKQFIKSDNRRNSERILKGFLSGCLKIVSSRRCSMFLRLLNFGEWIDKEDFSHKSFLLYLNLFLFMQNSQVGLLMYKDQDSSIQYYPYSRAQKCLKEYKLIFSKDTGKRLKIELEKLKINDPKQINPQGIIELELFFEVVLQEHEKIIKEVIENVKVLFSPFGETVEKEIMMIGICGVSGKDCKDLLEKEIDKKYEFSVDDCADLACKVGAANEEVVGRMMKEFLGLSEDEGKSLARSRLVVTGGKIAEMVVKSIENCPAKFGLLWMKILVSS